MKKSFWFPAGYLVTTVLIVTFYLSYLAFFRDLELEPVTVSESMTGAEVQQAEFNQRCDRILGFR